MGERFAIENGHVVGSSGKFKHTSYPEEIN